ncbi:hybrid sensor histidine kinase/response regulator [Frateuria defendens]|uniref:hybrid sensor histidine kinase/response regulator n=1 Tax=Frateuria defendens TaxID=2219559 RepID=UPI001F21BB60|nr:hybrid sensor histidine kinase/response regulator [Frateuria defendens]
MLLSMALLLGVLAPEAAAPSPGAVAVAPAAMPEGALPTPQFRRYDTAAGLPSTAVYAVVQDREGAMWFATKGGLARFDGVEFQVFRHVAGDPDSLYNNNLSTLLLDRQGKLWAGGLDAGLNRYDPATGRFRHWGHDPADPDSLASGRVWAIAQSADGSLWVGTVRGLDRMRPDGLFEHVANPLLGADPAAFGTVAALYEDPRGQLWVGSSRGVFRRDAQGRFHAVGTGVPGQLLDAWRIDGDGTQVRIDAVDGLYLVGADDVAWPFSSAALAQGNVMSSVRDAAGRLWIGTKKGLYLQTGPDAPVTAVMDRPVLYGNLPGSWIWQLYADREGGLWVTLLDGGVAYLAPGWHSFSRFTHVPDDPASLRDAVATTMARVRDDRHLWVGERGGRVDRLDPATGAVEHVLSDLHGDVLGMTEDADRRLWVAVQGALYRTRDGKADRVDPQGRWLRHPLEVEQGPDRRLYVRTFGEGVFRVDPDTLEVTPVPIRSRDDKVLWGAQMTLESSRGVFWYASEGGLMRLDAGHAHFELVPGAPTGRPVEAFDFSPDGLWTAGPDGLEQYRYRGEGLALVRHVDGARGWPSVNVVDLRVDARGRVWVFGRDGLWRFDPASESFRSFGLQDGLSNGEFSRGFARLAGRDTVYAPSLGGVVAFDPDRVDEQRTVPQLAITRVGVQRGVVATSLPLSAGRSIEVGWRDRQLRVEARVFSYADPAANRYRFHLTGLDNGWVDTGNRGEREFAGLAAGDYTLAVTAAGADGVWASVAPVSIHVEAPPWARWWARSAYALAVLGLGWLLFRAWQRRVAHRYAIDLAEQRRLLAEQASAAKTQFLATLSHEIRTPMTGVMGMAELLLTTPLSAVQHEYTQAMQRSGGMLLKLLNEALDLARIEAGRLELEPAPFDPHQLVEDVARLEIGQAQVKGLRFELMIADDLPSRVLGDAVRIKQVLLNLANNALKFTDVGSVKLSARWDHEGMLFSVQDTGPGIAESSRERLFQRFEQADGPQRRAGSGLGLAISRELVALMGGYIELESRLGHGSTFRVRLPLPVLDATPPERTAAAEPVPERALDVLLVEDDAIVAAVIRGLLERQRHRVCYAPNGLAALAELAERHIDVVLLDLDLPGVDGFRVARLIRQGEAPGTRVPIMAITARSGGDEETLSREAGMDGFLRKPLTGEQLAAVLAEVVRASEPQSQRPAEGVGRV